MAKQKTSAKKISYISVPSQIISSLSSSSLQSLLHSPKKQSKNKWFGLSSLNSARRWFLVFFVLGFIGILKLWLSLHLLFPYSPCLPCGATGESAVNNIRSRSQLGLVLNSNDSRALDKNLALNGEREFVEQISPGYQEVEGQQERNDFWKQPDGFGYKPCLRFSREYRTATGRVVNDRSKYLLVVVSGGLNQQMNQIVDAVVIARILGATLVVPILQVNVIWEDESEFSDIFDLKHFKRVLSDDVRVISSLPSTHVMTRPVERTNMPLYASPQWIRSNYLKRINREKVMLLRGLDSRLSKDLPSDLQNLRCKVAFQALRFAPPIMEIGNNIANRMRSKGPYIALHLRMEKDVWVRTGCLPGLSKDYDKEILVERETRPDLLTSRSNINFEQRKLAGLCPLNAVEVTRLLKALGAPSDARIYWAGGQPFGGKEALLPLSREFPHFYSKDDLALEGELGPFAKKASSLAAIDHIVSVSSDVFMPSHGGNMGHTIQGSRAFAGHKKYITPNKRQMIHHFLNSSLPEDEFNTIIKELHNESLGQPELRTHKSGRDVTKYPVPECMCRDN